MITYCCHSTVGNCYMTMQQRRLTGVVDVSHNSIGDFIAFEPLPHDIYTSRDILIGIHIHVLLIKGISCTSL